MGISRGPLTAAHRACNGLVGLVVAQPDLCENNEDVEEEHWAAHVDDDWGSA
jgi:hypothetical protein